MATKTSGKSKKPAPAKAKAPEGKAKSAKPAKETKETKEHKEPKEPAKEPVAKGKPAAKAKPAPVKAKTALDDLDDDVDEAELPFDDEETPIVEADDDLEAAPAGEDEDDDEEEGDEDAEKEGGAAKAAKAKPAPAKPKPASAAKKDPVEPTAVVPARRLTPEAKAKINELVKKGMPLGDALKAAGSWETFVAPVRDEQPKLVGKAFEGGPRRPRPQGAAAAGSGERNTPNEDEDTVGGGFDDEPIVAGDD